MTRTPRRLPRQNRPEDFAFLKRPSIGQMLLEIRQPLDDTCAQETPDAHVVIRAAERLAQLNGQSTAPAWHAGERLRLQSALQVALQGQMPAAPYDCLGRAAGRDQAIQLHDRLTAALEGCDVTRWQELLADPQVMQASAGRATDVSDGTAG